MVELRETGKARSVGVSNFLEKHLDDIAAASDVRPVVNQIELTRPLQQRALREHQGAVGHPHRVVGAPRAGASTRSRSCPGFADIA